MKQIKNLAAIGAVVVFSSFTVLNPVIPPAKKVAAYAHKAVVPYQVDAAQSKLIWLAKKVTGEHSGTIAISEGTFNVENKVLKGGSFDLDTKTITVTDLTDQEANAKLLGHLKSDDFFAVDKFDKARFVITSAATKGGGIYAIKGNLTIKGITNEVSFPATVKIGAAQLTAKAKILVDRTKYNIKFRSKSFFENLGDKTIEDNFELNIQLTANK